MSPGRAPKVRRLIAAWSQTCRQPASRRGPNVGSWFAFYLSKHRRPQKVRPVLTSERGTGLASSKDAYETHSTRRGTARHAIEDIGAQHPHNRRVAREASQQPRPARPDRRYSDRFLRKHAVCLSPHRLVHRLGDTQYGPFRHRGLRSISLRAADDGGVAGGDLSFGVGDDYAESPER